MVDNVLAARASVEVRAGVLPGSPDPKWSKRWFVTNKQWDEAVSNSADTALITILALLAETSGPAMAYANSLAMRPELVNWVRLEWVWS